MKHLWEVEHDYYCSEEHYFGTGENGPVNQEFESIAGFLEEWEDADEEYNLLFRWDWEEDEEKHFNGDVNYRNGKLKLFFFLQRKGFHLPVTVCVCRADEPLVIKYLKPKLEYMKALWSPLDEN